MEDGLKHVIKCQQEALEEAKKALANISSATYPETTKLCHLKIRKMKTLALNAWREIRRKELESEDQGNYFCESCEKYFSGKPDNTSNCWFCSSTNVFEALEE